MADLAAVGVLLVIEGPLFLAGDMAMILTCHIPFFLPHFVIVTMQLGGTPRADLALGPFPVDPAILVSQTAIYLGAAGMSVIEMTGLRETSGRKAKNGDESGN